MTDYIRGTNTPLEHTINELANHKIQTAGECFDRLASRVQEYGSPTYRLRECRFCRVLGIAYSGDSCLQSQLLYAYIEGMQVGVSTSDANLNTAVTRPGGRKHATSTEERRCTRSEVLLQERRLPAWPRVTYTQYCVVILSGFADRRNS
jgi:hypothetical protein